MVHKVLIDEQALGWIKDNQSKVEEDYEIIYKVGTEPAPKQGSGDKTIGRFCEEKCCNLITGDYTAYLDILENSRIHAIQIEKYSADKAERRMYLRHCSVLGRFT
ncbi:hypothetical protein NsoK4_06885 [Nitrosopumilus sp. K4]|uniref:hypothetical protein n=1 Tax=Nitrosopumilus sp. K4 TaxID=2795383 RepID=UPI001BA8D68D|nr:hypothetical protein [Nitrosopumilus sp. K4]QUC64165.1 hypothetical protein NsoK4_06885 [Nitrosopumilus sp. K4]